VLDSRQEQPVAAFAELFNSGALPPLMQVTHTESTAGLGRRMGQLPTGAVRLNSSVPQASPQSILFLLCPSVANMLTGLL